MTNDEYYVVTQGDYSDYHIVAVTTDYEVAEKIAAKFTTRYDECRVEEYSDATVMLRPAWIIYFNKNGNVDNVRSCDSSYDYSNIGAVHENPPSYTQYAHIVVTVSADDEASAIKIAAEKRAKYLAEKMGL